MCRGNFWINCANFYGPIGIVHLVKVIKESAAKKKKATEESLVPVESEGEDVKNFN